MGERNEKFCGSRELMERFPLSVPALPPSSRIFGGYPTVKR